MEQKKIERISELSRKSRAEGLTEEEKLEQQALRQEYIQSMRQSLRATLDNSVIVRPDGTKEKVSDAQRKSKEKARPFGRAFFNHFVPVSACGRLR